VGRKSFVLELIGVVIIALIASALRLYFDLVEVYTVQLGLQTWPEGAQKIQSAQRQIRRTFMPALRGVRHQLHPLLYHLRFPWRSGDRHRRFHRAHSHALAGQAPCVAAVPARANRPFLMLFTRFWQRGAETILALDNPLPLPLVIVPEPVATEVIVVIPVSAAHDAVPDASEEGGYNPEALEAPPTEAKPHDPIDPASGDSEVII